MKRDPYAPLTPRGPMSVSELLRFTGPRERREYHLSRQLGNFRIRKRGKRVWGVVVGKPLIRRGEGDPAVTLDWQRHPILIS